ncbi:hypothetical protein FRC00_011671 [Tulasnella sp. 408]|nr:hypothetical protein FRC00_011671 [Tulasnella sp. 408]
MAKAQTTWLERRAIVKSRYVIKSLSLRPPDITSFLADVSGLNQAKAVGEYFAKHPITAIFASPLKRALTTAQQIEKQNQSKPPLTITPLIREQHFGEAEGNPWAPSITPNPKGPNDPNATGRLGVIDPKTNKKVYPVQPGRTAKFPAGESQDDVAERTGEAFDEFVMPFVRESVGKPAAEVNVFFVRQKGGIGSMAHDETQKAITDFFGGGGKSKEEKEKDAMDVDTSTGSNL